MDSYVIGETDFASSINSGRNFSHDLCILSYACVDGRQTKGLIRRGKTWALDISLLNAIKMPKKGLREPRLLLCFEMMFVPYLYSFVLSLTDALWLANDW